MFFHLKQLLSRSTCSRCTLHTVIHLLHAFSPNFMEYILKHVMCFQLHEMAIVSSIQEAQKDNLRSFNNYMMQVLEVVYPFLLLTSFYIYIYIYMIWFSCCKPVGSAFQIALSYVILVYVKSFSSNFCIIWGFVYVITYMYYCIAH